jgi:hypothetical protein
MGRTMNSTSQDVLGEFMSDKNREALGEKADTIEANNDNFLPDEEKAKNTFGEETVSKDDKRYLIARQALSAAVTVPLFICALISVFYMLSRVVPYMVVLVKRFFVAIA